MQYILNRKVQDGKKILLLMFIPMVLIGKLIRWTLMKKVLVDTSSGHEIINAINGISDAKRYAVIETIPFYKLINIFNLTTFTEYEIYLSFVLNIILLILFFEINRNLNILEFTFFVASVTVLNLFDFTLAKEPIQFLYFLLLFLVLMLFRKRNSIFAGSIMILVACAVLFRSYYYLMTLYFIIVCMGYQLSENKQIDKRKIIPVAVLVFTLLYLSILYMTKNFSPDIYADLIRVRSRSGDAKTVITPLIDSGNLFLFSCNYMLTLIRMMFPVELMRFGVKYFIYVIYQLMITGFVMQKLKNIREQTVKPYIATMLMLAFILCSATFEPDFGSWIRHEAVTFPIIMIMLDTVKMTNYC